MSDTSNQIDPRSHKYIGNEISDRKGIGSIAGDYIDEITPYIKWCAVSREFSSLKTENGVREKRSHLKGETYHMHHDQVW
jgi:hypothetical protein